MKTFLVEVFDEDKPCPLENDRIEAVSIHTAAARAIKMATLRRGCKKVVVRVMPIGKTTKLEDNE